MVDAATPLSVAGEWKAHDASHLAAPVNAGAHTGAVIRRALDLLFAGALFLFLLPALGMIAAAIWIQDGGPVLFGHSRVGRNGRAFKCLKFRSMVLDAEDRLQALLKSSTEARAEWAKDHKLRRDPRVTSLGRFLRASSLDELPQLINVIRGEMSLVGPRPIVVAEIPRYRRYFREYCMVAPGITGLWQVSGRNDVSYVRRVALDVAYVRALSTRLYFKILLATIPAVLVRRGAF